MKYNYFKNCRVVINAGTEVLKIDGMGAPARETPAQEVEKLQRVCMKCVTQSSDRRLSADITK